MAGPIKSLSFSLFDIEKSISQREYTKFESYLTEFFEYIEHRNKIESILNTDSNGTVTCSHKGLVPFTNQMTHNEKADLYSRLAASITTYLSDSTYTPPNELLIRFVLYKTHVTNIFYLSCYGSMDHILFNRDLLDESLSLKLKTEQDIKFLYVCLTLNTRVQFSPEQIVNALADWGMYWYLGMLYGFQHPYNERIANNFNLIFEAHAIIKNMKLDTTAAELAASPWMLCSYLDRNDRHDMKVSINTAMENWVTSKHLSPGSAKKAEGYIAKTTQVKKIVILSEHYTSSHAMYRCNHPELKILKEKFHVTLVSDPSKYDALSSKDFDQIIDIKDTAQDLSDVIKAIIKLEPDLIFFPSLGMAKWTVPLANLRLAKYQMMGYGHPASAFSKYIDYSYSSEPKPDWNFQQFCMEKIVPVYQGKNFIWEPHPEYAPLNTQKPDDGVVRIAINSSLPKITPRFIQMCRILLEHSTVPVEFNFFLISHDLAFEKSVIIRLGGATKVHPPADYMTYMKNLAICDLAIGTFPFGGSNTNTDLALLNIPKVFYSEGCGIASYADETALEKLNLPEILTPKSEGDLLANLIYIIHNKPLREELSENIRKSDPYKLFYAHKTDKEAEDNCKLVKAIKWIEENHTEYKETASVEDFNKSEAGMIEIDFGNISVTNPSNS
jgi:hypothetical protein